MAQLMGQQGGGGGAPKSAEEQAAAEEQREAAEEQRRAMLMNLMQPSARDRRERWLVVGVCFGAQASGPAAVLPPLLPPSASLPRPCSPSGTHQPGQARQGARD